MNEERWGFEETHEIAPGRYALKLLGGGHRYEAYLAHDETLLSLVVVKILRPNRVSDDGSLRGLAGEYRILRKLNHPSIARAFDAMLEGPRPHLVLEFLDGPRLSTLIRKFGRLPLEQSIPLAVQVCSALHYMHTQNYVHLDVKPGNIIMGAPPRLIDMSIARTLTDAQALKVPVGTDAYMAPEQCLVDQRIPIGQEADVWGLGVTLYHSVAGKLPFPPATDEKRFPQLDLEPESLLDEQIPPRVAELILACMQKNPFDRPTTKELAAALEPLVAALPRRPVLSRLRPRMR